MKFARTVAPVLLTLSMAPALLTSSHAQPSVARTTFRALTYRVVDLGVLPGREACGCFSPAAISDNGIVVGRYFGAAGDHRGFLWQDGVMSDLGVVAAPHGGLGSFRPSSVNSSGRAVGFGPEAACFSDFGILTSLATLGGPFGVASDINDSGMIVGQASLADGLSHAVMWTLDGTVVTDLGAFDGRLSQALAVNEAGTVVGSSANAAFQDRAFVWTAATGMVELASPAGTLRSSARDINAAGTIIGTAQVTLPPGNEPPIQERGIIWINGVPADLGDLGDPGDLPVIPTAINDAGVVVGSSLREGSDIVRAFRWENGVMTDLNTLLVPGSGWTLQIATDINNKGQITGLAVRGDGLLHAVVLDPVAPTTSVPRRLNRGRPAPRLFPIP